MNPVIQIVTSYVFAFVEMSAYFIIVYIIYRLVKYPVRAFWDIIVGLIKARP